MAPFFIVAAVLHGILIAFTDRILVGVHNGCYGRNDLYVIDRTVRYKVHSPVSIVEELQDRQRPVGARKADIDHAIKIATAASEVFQEAGAHFAEHNWHWQIANADIVKRKMLPALKILSHAELEVVSGLLDTEGKHAISFSRFCLYIGKAVKSRFKRQESTMSMQLSLREMYGSAHSLSSIIAQTEDDAA